MGEPRKYLGTFCTGHVPMVGTTSIQFSENSMHEYIEEYKSAHGMKTKSGPGLAKQYDFRTVERKQAPPLPIQGCALGRMNTAPSGTLFPQRQTLTSSKAVGGWWNDPIFQQKGEATDFHAKGPPPPCTRITTSSEIGQYWHDDEMDNPHADEDMARLRAANGCKRVLPVEENSQFALEDLPTQHRLL